ncbi:MAG: hypothetical protein IT349_12835 [Candidatus Eisenbacteria bacterium]|nr:hypothetical protein [Candidatus Eisenbacteria bacterium]
MTLRLLEKRSVELTSAERWYMHLANGLVGGSGLVYAGFRYLAKSDDPYSTLHPAVPTTQHLHVLLAPALVFAAGLLWKTHIHPRWHAKGSPRRTSGVALVLALFPMLVSGYLLQVATDERWRTVWVAVHLSASAAWLLGYGGHVFRALAAGRHDRLDRPVSTLGHPRRGDPSAPGSTEHAAAGQAND